MTRYAVVNTSTNKVITVVDSEDPFDPGTGLIIVASETAQTGWDYDPITGDLTAPVPTPQQQLDATYATFQTTPYVFEGHNYSPVPSTITLILPNVLAALYQTPADAVIITDDAGAQVLITRADILDMFSALYDLWQSGIYAYKTVEAAVTGATLTDYSLVDAAFSAALAAAPAGAKISTPSDLATIISGLTLDDIGAGTTNLAFTATLKSKLDALPDDATLAAALATKATPTDISTAISNLVNGAPGILDTLAEIDAALQADEGTAAALATTVTGKVDKVTGKGLSTNDFTTALLNKLNAIAAGATAYTDANAIAALLTGLSTGTNAAVVATDSVLAAIGKLQAQITALAGKFARSTSAFSLSLVGTGATGTQVNATKDSTIRVNLSESVTSTIGGAAISAIQLKKCATNSATETDWTTIATFEEDQTVTLAIALQSVQVMKGQLETDVPASWWVKATTVGGTGTHAESVLTGEKTIYG